MNTGNTTYFSSMTIDEYLRMNQDKIAPDVLQQMLRMWQEYEQRLRKMTDKMRQLHEEWNTISSNQKELLLDWKKLAEELAECLLPSHLGKDFKTRLLYLQEDTHGVCQADDPYLEEVEHA